MNEIELKYIGACDLLASLFERTDDAEKKIAIHQAVKDCADIFPDDFTFKETKLRRSRMIANSKYIARISLEPKL